MKESKPSSRNEARSFSYSGSQYCVVLSGRDVDGCMQGSLSSTALDSLLYPKGVATVEIAADVPHASSGSPPSIDAFAAASLAEFLAAQRSLRQTLENELRHARDKWNPDKQPDKSDIWRDSKVILVSFYRKNVPTPAALRNWQRIFHVPSEVIIAHSDRAETRSSFKITIRVTWASDHRNWSFRFRDGLLADITTE